MSNNTKFYSIEYVDEEGEIVIRHSFLTDEQKNILLEEFKNRNMKANIYNLASQDENYFQPFSLLDK